MCQENTPRYYYNSQVGYCEKFTYRGCKGNNNNFKTEEACQQACIETPFRQTYECTLPLKQGNCPLSLQRYYFNTTTGMCEEFIYKGCNGNLNNFLTLEECESKCLKVIPPNLKKERCNSEPDPGPCMAAIQRFYYSSLSGHCFLFTYGGCGGNANNYNSMESCQSACRKNVETYI